MQYLFFFVMACALVMLTGCGPQGTDYEASAACQTRGEQPGTKAFDDCVKEERMNRLSRQMQEREEIQRQREEQQKILRR